MQRGFVRMRSWRISSSPGINQNILRPGQAAAHESRRCECAGSGVRRTPIRLFHGQWVWSRSSKDPWMNSMEVRMYITIGLALASSFSAACTHSDRPGVHEPVPNSAPIEQFTVLTYNMLHGLEVRGRSVGPGESKEEQAALPSPSPGESSGSGTADDCRRLSERHGASETNRLSVPHGQASKAESLSRAGTVRRTDSVLRSTGIRSLWCVEYL